MTNEAVDYITNTSDALPIVGVPQISSLVFVVDGTLDEETMVPVRQALKMVGRFILTRFPELNNLSNV